MARFIGFNSALSTTTAINAGQNLAATTAVVTLQLSIPNNGLIQLVEWGCSMDLSSATVPFLFEVATTDAATTSLTGHTTTTIKPYDYCNVGGVASRLTMGTGDTGYGNATIITNTTLRPLDRQYVAPTNQFVKMWPLMQGPMVGSAATENYVQFRVKPSVSTSTNLILYAVWDEFI